MIKSAAVNKVLVIGAIGGVLLVLGDADQAYASFREEVIRLNDFRVSNKSASEISLQEGNVFNSFIALVEAMSGGVVDDYTKAILYVYVYKRLIPQLAMP
jgi:hypothetical protein